MSSPSLLVTGARIRRISRSSKYNQAIVILCELFFDMRQQVDEWQRRRSIGFAGSCDEKREAVKSRLTTTCSDAGSEKNGGLLLMHAKQKRGPNLVWSRGRRRLVSKNSGCQRNRGLGIPDRLNSVSRDVEASLTREFLPDALCVQENPASESTIGPLIEIDNRTTVGLDPLSLEWGSGGSHAD